MTYESLMIANQTITKIEVKGKEYAEVNQRIRVFRMLYPNGSIETNIESLENNGSGRRMSVLILIWKNQFHFLMMQWLCCVIPSRKSVRLSRN